MKTNIFIISLLIFIFFNKNIYSQCVSAPCGAGETQVDIHIETDFWGDETSWVIYDNTAGTGCGIDPFGTDCYLGTSTLSGWSTYDWSLCYPTGNSLTIYIGDDASDGGAYYEITIGGVLVASGTQSGCVWSGDFTATNLSAATAGDCANAINVCTDLGFQIDANGYGSINEIPDLGTIGNPDNNNPGGSGNMGCLRSAIPENNSTWMIVNIGSTGNLEFNFGGTSQAGFYDWIMYPYTPTSCSDIPTGNVAPVRCNWNASNSGGTGLDNTPNSPGTQDAGNFEPALPVICGEQYIICFSNYSSALTSVPLSFGGTAVVECGAMTCAGSAACSATPGNPDYQDCIGAIPVCQNYFCQEYSFTGTGAITTEINSGPSCLNSGEKNDAWYTFTVQQSGNLSFTITPNATSDDYDWAVYNLTNNVCSDIYGTSSLEVSCNYSSNIGCNGLTGPNGENVNCAGQNEDIIPVTAGQTYVVNVSNFSSSQSGYVLDFSASTAVIFDDVPPQLDVITTTQVCGSTTVTFRFTEQVLCSSVQACDFTITGPGGPYTVSSVAGPGCTGSGTQGSEFTVTFSPGLSTAGNFNLNLVSACGWVEDLCGNVAVDGSLPFTIAGPTSSMTQTNVLCNGATTGSATVTIVGGSPNYTYDWSHLAPVTNASASNTVTGLAAGTYYVTITANGGCSVLDSVIITEPPVPMTITLVPTPESCNGANDGSIEITVLNGTPNYNYTCTGQTNQNNKPSPFTFPNLSSTSYNVCATDANTCSACATATVNAGVVVTAAFSTGSNQCYNALGNSFTMDNTSTNATSYLWTFAGGTPSTSADFEPTVTFNTAGAHNITLTASNGASCSNLTSINLTIYDLPVVTLNVDSVSCNGFCDGSISATVTGGSGVYSTYTWSPAQPNSPNISGLCPNVYSLIVKDSYNCSSNSVSATVYEPVALSATISRTNASCNGVCDGDAQAIASGGSGSYTYLWSTGDNTVTITGLCDGTYTVSVYDALSSPLCYITANTVVIEPVAMVLTTSSTNSNCGLATGTASVTVTNGTPNYNFSWTWGGSGSNNTTTPSNTNTVFNLPSGPVNITVTDLGGSGCSVSTIINISDDAGATSFISDSTNVLCNGDSTGSATVTVTGGTSPYDYAWSNGDATNGSALLTNTANGLPDGTYTVVITDGVGCVTSSSVTITESVALVASTSFVSSNCGQSDGSATVNAGGGVSPYTYLWDGGGITSTITNKPAGEYCVTVTDFSSCTITKCVTITDIGGITSLSTTQTDVSCFSGNDGEACVTVNGGTSPYTYKWCNNQTTQCATGLPYTGSDCCVTVTDDVGCILIACVTITQPTQVTATISASDSVNCSGGSDGSATVVGSGGTSPYTFIWSASAGFQTTATADSLSAGIYCVTVKDDNFCSSASVCVTISQPTILSANITSTTQAHCGNADGGATVVASGGITPYSYSWTYGTPSNSSTVTGLSSANSPHIVTVSDFYGCTVTASATITDFPAGTASISFQQNVSCNGLCDGKLTVSVSSATSPFTYVWSGGQTTAAITGLCASDYSVTVTDTYGCTMTTSATITEPAPLTVSFSPEPASCFGSCNGEATLSPSGGTSSYDYIWSTGSTSSSLSNLCKGKYYFTVTDFNGCQITDSVEISEPSQMTLVAVITSANCNQKDGAIDLTVSDGPSPFTYQWSYNGYTTEDIDSIPAGNYCVTVTNDKGCKIDSCFVVPNESGPIATITSFANLTCFNSCDGTATVSVTGGTPAYVYKWDDPDSQPTATATNLCAGDYNVTVIDSVGCAAYASITITQPDLLEYNLTVTNPTCADSCNGSAEVSPFGGTTPYTYLWYSIPLQTTAIADSLCAQNYDVVITDFNGCDTSITVALSQPTNIVLDITYTDVLCFGNSNGKATVTATGGTPYTSSFPYTYIWSNTQTTQMASGLIAGNYCVTVFDSYGCNDYICVTVFSPEVLDIVIDTTIDVKCFGNPEGAIVTHAIGGTPPYKYFWNNADTTSSIADLYAGTYILTVKDTNLCSKQISIIISQPPKLEVALDIDSVICSGECNGKITANVWGGTQITPTDPYDFIWSDAIQDSVAAINLCPGTYYVTITDNNSCQKIATGTVYEPPVLQLIVESTTNATCDSANGSATVGMMGGTTGYSIIWEDYWNGFTNDSLEAGYYGVTVYDINNCLTETNILIQNEGGPIIDTIIKTDLKCFGDTDASINIIYSGGTGTINVLWSNDSTNTLIYNLGVGTYSVTLTDANNCKTVGFEEIIGPQSPVASAINDNNPVKCYGFCDGSATVFAAGGSVDLLNSYTYRWIPSEQTTATATNLCAGIYTVICADTSGSVTVIDTSSGCLSVSYVTITEPLPISISLLQKEDISCFGFQDGKITISATGGSYVFNYVWQTNPTQPGPTASNLSEGTYTIIVSEIGNSSCFATYSDSVFEPEPIVATLDYISPKCSPYYSNGSIFVTDVTGGVSPYSYNWGQNNYNDTLSNVSSGNYGVIVSDFNNCPQFYSVNLDYIHPPIISDPIVTNVTCSQNIDGTALITVKEGTPPFDYEWSPNNGTWVISDSFDTLSLSDLSGNIYPPTYYSLTVTDANECDTTTIFSISSPNPLTVTGYGPSDKVCNGANLTIYASANGGTQPYQYLWNQNLSAVASHVVNPTAYTSYNVTITDANGCSSSVSIPVSVHNLITVTLEAEDTVICSGDPDSLFANHSRGAGAPYTVTWSNIGTSQDTSINVFPLSTETYTVTIKDMCNSKDTASVTITVNPLPELLINSDEYFGCEPLTVIFNNKLHETGYTYNWNFGDNTAGGLNFSKDSLPTHIYNNSNSYDVSVQVKSDAGCPKDTLVEDMITVFPNPNAVFSSFPEPTGAFKPMVTFYDQSTVLTGQIVLWQWNFGDDISPENTSTIQQPIHYYTDAGIYNVYLYIETDNGCVDSTEKPVTILDEHTFWAPTAFTPAAGGQNTEWYPVGIGVDSKNYHLYIFDRWGEIIFQTDVFYDDISKKGVEGKWNGKVRNKGKIVEMGVYTWLVQLKDILGNDHEYAGSVTVIK